MNARRSLSASACASTPRHYGRGRRAPDQTRFPTARFSFASGKPHLALGGGWCPGWPQATPKGPQGLDTSCSQRTLSRLEARPPAPVNHAPQAGTEDDTLSASPASPFPLTSTTSWPPPPIPATHMTGRGASNDGQPILKLIQRVPGSYSDLGFLVELWGFEPQTSCMPSSGNPSTGVCSRRSPSRRVHPRPPASRPVAVLSCCTHRQVHSRPGTLRYFSLHYPGPPSVPRSGPGRPPDTATVQDDPVGACARHLHVPRFGRGSHPSADERIFTLVVAQALLSFGTFRPLMLTRSSLRTRDLPSKAHGGQ